MLRVGLLGIGFMGMMHYRAYQRLRGVKVRALCTRDPVRRDGDWRTIKGNFGPPGERMDLSGVARYADLDEMLADPELDLIDICLPTSCHAPAAIQALKAGKHVLCEKPIALKPSDASTMVAAATKANRALMIGHVLPFFPEYRFAYDAIASKKYGRLLGGHFKRFISEPQWMPGYFDPAIIGGPLLDLHVHDAHFIRLIAGMPTSVQCSGTMRGEVVERFSAQFRFADPEVTVSAASGVIPQPGRPFTHGYEIYLEQATLLFDFAAIDGQSLLAMPVTVLLNSGKVHRPKLGSGDACAPFVAELSEAVRAIRSGIPSPVLAGDLARDAVILCRKETQAVISGRTVSIENGAARLKNEKA